MIPAIVKTSEVFLREFQNSPTESFPEDFCNEHQNAEYSCGMCRQVVIFPRENIVFKISLANVFYSQYEAYAYQRAEEYGCAEMIAPVKFRANCGSYVVYEQPIISRLAHSDLDTTENNKEIDNIRLDTYDGKLDGEYLNSYMVPRTWIKNCLKFYSEAVIKAFCRWTKDFRINDLHEDNLGYIKDKPQVFDYSGYGRPYRESIRVAGFVTKSEEEEDEEEDSLLSFFWDES